jgi:hypothetical protein
MPELAEDLATVCGAKADPASLSRWLIRNGYRFKKTLLASECDRPDIRQAREEWRAERQPKMRLEPHRLVFLDKTGTTTKMTRPRGRCLKGERLRSKAPFGHWKDLHRRIALRRPHRALRRRRADGPANLRNLCRDPARPDARTRRQPSLSLSLRFQNGHGLHPADQEILQPSRTPCAHLEVESSGQVSSSRFRPVGLALAESHSDRDSSLQRGEVATVGMRALESGFGSFG